MNRKTVLLIVLLVILSGVVFCQTEAYLYRKSWEKETSPLPKETVLTLCKNLELDNEHPLCNGSKDVYALDFNELIIDYFALEDTYETPKDKATVTYEEVYDIIGKFEKSCEEVTHALDISYYRCIYDLRGDGYWRDAFYFYYPENTLFSIRSGSARED